jgi:superfamily II DNA or RNA helicase
VSRKEPRYYQKEICNAIVQSWGRNEIPYGSVLGGLGKSLCFAMLTDHYVNKGERVLQLVPRLELVEQNAKETFNYMENKKALGIVCGQLNKKQNNRQAVIAMASSFVGLRTKSGSFDKILIDECHRVKFINNEGNPGIYEKIIKSLLRINPNCQVCGLSGSSYRLDQGELHDISHKTLPFFTHKVYDTAVHPGIPRLISEGYLAHIHTLNTNVHVDLDGVKVVNGDYSKDEAGKKFDLIIDDAISDMKQQFEDNNIETAIIFVSNLKNAKHVLDAWGDNSTMRIVCGDDAICTKTQRKQAIDWIKNGTGRRFLLNIDLLAEGFDYTALQCVVLLRATKSPGLMSQIIFRIIRPHSDKEHSFLLDYGTNCERLGTVDKIIVPKPKKKKGDAPRKLCLAALESNIEFEGIKYKKGQDCNYANLLSAKKCRKCGAEFINETEDGLYAMRTKSQAIQAKIELETFSYSVDKVYYEKSYSRKDQTEMIKVRFYDEDINHIHDSYLTLNHRGFARDNSIKMLISMLKNPSDYSDIAQFEGGVNVDNVLLLLDNDDYREQYFKKIKSITLAPQVGGRFKELKSLQYY